MNLPEASTLEISSQKEIFRLLLLFFFAVVGDEHLTGSKTESLAFITHL